MNVSSHDPFLLRCGGCGEWVDERTQTVWSKVEGWEKRRAQGGTNHIALRKPLPEFMCAGCMEKMLSGIHAGQVALGW